MTRFMRAALTAVVAVGGLTAVGCMSSGDRPGVQARYNNYVDPNYPQDYQSHARGAVLHPFETQARNAVIREATVGNYFFKPGSDELTDAGRQRLDYLARRTGCQDNHLYLQTARDLEYDAANPGKLVAARADLDAKRGQTVLAYMGAQPGAKQYDITPLDPQDTGLSVIGPATAVRGLAAQYRSGITGSAGLPLTGTGGGPAAAAPGVPSSGTAGTNGPAGAGGGSAGGSGGGGSGSGGGR